MIKHGSKLIQAVAERHGAADHDPVRRSFGAGNYGMCGRGFEPRFVFAWPNRQAPP